MQDSNRGISCKRKDILKLPLSEYKKITNGFIAAAKCLMGQNFYRAKDIPYRTQLILLAAIFSVLGDKTEQDTAKRFIARWYWCGVLGELYGSASETPFAKDVPEVVKWLDDGQEPTTVKE